MMKLSQLLDSKKIVPFYRERKDKTDEELPPISVELHWTSNCNYDCVHCSYGSRRKTKGYLNKEMTEAVVDDLIKMECQAVYLSGGGEPTVLSGWERYAEKFINSGVEVALITNGVAIKEKHLPVIRKMNYVAVSIYSTEEERYNKITDSRFFNEQFSLPKKIKQEVYSVIVGARCVLNEVNFDEVYEIYATAIDSGFDYVIFIPAVDYEGRGVVLEQSWVDHVGQQIKENLDRFDHDRTNVKSLVNKKVSHYMINDYRENIPVSVEGCKSIQIRGSVFVNYNGGVYLCQPDIGDAQYEIGNLGENKFSEIWNSEKHHRVIEQLNHRYDSGRCRNCRSIAFNQSIYEDDSGVLGNDMLIKQDPFV